MQDYIYSVISSVALAIHLVLNYELLTNRRRTDVSRGLRECRQFLVSLLAYYVTDAAWGVIAGLGITWLLSADTVFYYLALAITVQMWSRYVVVHLGIGGWLGRLMVWSGWALLVFYAVTLTANFFVGGFFHFDAKGMYVAGPVRHLAFYLLVAFNVFCTVSTLVKALRSRDEVRRHNMSVFLFGFTMMASVILQTLWPLLPLYAIGCLVGSSFLHVFVIEDERDRVLAAEQAKRLFFSSVSHDIRTPLNAIVGFSELLEQGVEDAVERRRYVTTIRSSGKMLARLVDDILDLSKLEDGRMEILREPTDVQAVVHEVVEAFGVVRANKAIVLSVETAEMPLVNVDPQRIRQFLYNLLSNAFKYTDQGRILLKTTWKAGTLALSVSDTGKGISPENIARVLQPFVQVADRNHRDGTGLGLAICQRLATFMGGELTIKSTLGKGSTFTVTLHDVEVVPGAVAERKPPPVQAPRPETTDRDNAMMRVLVVDDSSVNVMVLKAMILRCGVKDVVTAENGRSALEILKSDSKFDVVLSDLWMPEMDGEALVKAVRAEPTLAHLPVYLITADVEAIPQYKGLGFTGELLKPITYEGVKTLLDGLHGAPNP